MDSDQPLKEIFEEYLASGDVKLPPFDKTARRVQAGNQQIGAGH